MREKNMAEAIGCSLYIELKALGFEELRGLSGNFRLLLVTLGELLISRVSRLSRTSSSSLIQGSPARLVIIAFPS
jgi:hypothetical protein